MNDVYHVRTLIYFLASECSVLVWREFHILCTLPVTHEISKEQLKKAHRVRYILEAEFRLLSVNGFICECVFDFRCQLRGKEADPNVSLPVWQHGGGDLGAVVLLLYQSTSSTTEETCAAAS